ncbi:MAG: Ppx/GppA family phosphatase [Gammaproteobacteria bacterium]|nr:MAG: Ppx/GppA family phosphatase [Gammaproteobacteria bacterium]
MIVARLENGALRVMDRHREMVRLADGLDDRQLLSVDAQSRALDCLRRFGQRLRELDSEDVRAVGTNTFRAADNASGFIEEAEQALGHPIDIISGVEEARLIYLGVARSRRSDDGRRLVLDIGGGSTELILGKALETDRMNSFYMGCVSMSRRFFANGKVSEKAMDAAETSARQELEPVENLYMCDHWDTALGASGTIKAAARIAFENGWCKEEGVVSKSALKQMKKALLDAGRIDKLNLKGLDDNRRPVLPGGIVILRAVFSTFGIDAMQVSSGALREGLLHDLIGRIRHEDVREYSVRALEKRSGVDADQATRVRETALQMYRLVADEWKLDDEELEQMLAWAADLHEIGRMVAFNQYHKHGEYIIRNASLNGFSQQEQLLLAVLVRAHRRKFPADVFKSLPKRWSTQAIRLAILLRLAVTLNRGRTDVQLPDMCIKVSKSTITLDLPQDWLEFHPLTRADLASEAEYLATVDYKVVMPQ